MQETVVYSSPNFVLVAHYRALLASLGIPSRIRNEFLAGAAGEMPPLDCWPELRVAPIWLERAREVIAAAQAPVTDAEPWTCGGCGEAIEPQFAACWNCGAEA